jgi:GrpB-like predicted nucleotidyltransferase (UPF0157 family)
MTGLPGDNARAVVVDYNPEWPTWFAAIRDRITPALGSLALSIEHVGSTSVSGLAAKSVIDIDVVVADASVIPAAVNALTALGYEHLGSLGIPGREAFRRPPGTERHNLYVCPADSQGLRNHLALRHHLRTHPEAVEAYAALKRHLADEAPDIDAYVIGKTDLIISFLRAEGIDDETLVAIEHANTSPRL